MALPASEVLCILQIEFSPGYEIAQIDPVIMVNFGAGLARPGKKILGDLRHANAFSFYNLDNETSLAYGWLP